LEVASAFSADEAFLEFGHATRTRLRAETSCPKRSHPPKNLFWGGEVGEDGHFGVQARSRYFLKIGEVTYAV
jgi:hypothetical protein